ncbi:hypothetical protein LWI29_016219 [Acer saccharum]|uniref:Uncharacterized protein n=1 Tax=Acer saccharum TaxID=4024 RepID=A0AA39T2C0_ACESA|nr:hypothetical protein LWI29_016219 [Acer saccharum]
MSSDHTISDLDISWSNDDDGGVDSRTRDVDRRVTVEDPSTPVSINARGILKDSPASLITEDMLPGIRTMYGIPSDVELRAPREHERADWDIPGWMCLYEYTFRLGFRFPIPQLVRRMLVYYELAPEVGGAGKAPACDVAPERTRILLEIPAAQRSVSNLLTEVMTMASVEINIPDNAETLRSYKEEFARKRAAAQKKRQAAEKSAGGSPSVVEPILESSPERSPLKKKQRRAPVVERQKKAASSSKDRLAGPDFEPDSPMKLLASGLSSFKDPAGFLKRSDDFTLVDDDMHLKRVKTEEAYQATLHLHGRYKAINDKSVALCKVGDALKAENAKLSTEKSLIEQQKVALEEELKNERARHQAEVARLNEAASQQDKTIEALRERALSIAVEAVCKTRAELFKEYLSGDHLKWNPQTMQEEIDMYEEMQRLKLEESQGAGVDVDVENADGNLGDDASLDRHEAAATDGPPQDGL